MVQLKKANSANIVPVGASLLAMAARHSMPMLEVQSRSRASPLPQDSAVLRKKFGSYKRSNSAKEPFQQAAQG
jgi:hypothetical protein